MSSCKGVTRKKRERETAEAAHLVGFCDEWRAGSREGCAAGERRPFWEKYLGLVSVSLPQHCKWNDLTRSEVFDLCARCIPALTRHSFFFFISMHALSRSFSYY